MNLKLVEKMKQYYLKKFNVQIDDYSGSVAAKEVKIPCLVIHDTENNGVPVSCAYQIRQNLQLGEIYITNGFGHSRILKENPVISKIIEFVKRTTQNEKNNTNNNIAEPSLVQ